VNRSVTILGVILIAQIILYAFVSIDKHHVQTKESFLKADSSQIDYIKIVNEDGELVMKKIGATWKITEPINWTANASYIKTLKEKINNLKVESVITSNENKYPLYELDDIAAKYVEIGKEGGVIDKFYCGKASDSYTHTYVRRADSDEVLLVSGSPRSSFSRKPEQWRDKKILALDRTMIERILLKFPKETVELVRTITEGSDNDSGYVLPDTSWQAIPSKGKPFTPVDKALNRIMNTLKRCNAISFLDAGKDTIPDFSKPEFTIEVFLEGDQHETLDFIPKEDEETRFIARKNGDESTMFVVYQSSVKNLRKNPAALRGEDEKDKVK